MWKTYPPQFVVLNFTNVTSTSYTINFIDANLIPIPVPVQTGFTIYTVHSTTVGSTSFTTNLPTSLTNVDYLVVAGGGGGGGGNNDGHGGGGGAGGVLHGTGLTFNPATPYILTVGTGGAGTPFQTPGNNGTNSILNYANTTPIIAIGGGGGGSGFVPNNNGAEGGSGGGAGQDPDTIGGNGGN